MKKVFSIVLLLIAVFVACKDNDVKVDVTARLTAAPRGWGLVAIKAVGDQTNTNIVDSYEACKKDNSYVFDSDGTFTVYNNELRCGSEGNIVGTGKWSLNPDQTELTFGGIVIKQLTVTETLITGTYARNEGTALISYEKKA